VDRCSDETASIQVDFCGATSPVRQYLLLARHKEVNDHGSVIWNHEGALLSCALVAVFWTAGTPNDCNALQRRCDHSRIRAIISAYVRPASIYLSKDFPDPHLSGKNHEVVLMDGRDHAGFSVAHRVEVSSKASRFEATLCREFLSGLLRCGQ
jgi:hypothetical protein